MMNFYDFSYYKIILILLIKIIIFYMKFFSIYFKKYDFEKMFLKFI